MKKLTANDPETKSADLLAENIERLKALFPEACVEGKVDFDVLKQLLSGAIDEREEKYGLNWHGKRRARQLALTPSTGTLRPCPEESVDWDTTQNLMIEGDNLEVLKLLQKSYAGKVKLIYIDPPYNTGKDFVYPDDFKDNIKNYLELTGQVDGAGRKISSNTETSGRFHTDWLNMMYPRLKLARNLMRGDGLIFISIDDNEVHDLRLLSDEIFGEENFLILLVWKKSYGGGAKVKHVIGLHEYVLVYSRSKEALGPLELPHDPKVLKYYKHRDSKFPTRGPYRLQPLATTSMDDRPNLRFGISWEGEEVWPEKQWQWSKERVEQAVRNDELVISKKRGRWVVDYKQYLRDEDGKERSAKPFSLIEGPYTQVGTTELRALELQESGFTFPKPVGLIRALLNYCREDAIVLDFFAGSGTTAQAVLEMNDQDQGKRHFILVQLPEPTEGRTYRTIADITKERIRRVIKNLNDSEATELPTQGAPKHDRGFRVFKLAASNIQAWQPDLQDLEKALRDSVDHLKSNRTEADILYELLLKRGLDLCVPIEQKTIAGKTVYSIGGGVLFACLATEVSREAVEPVAHGICAWRKALAPAGDTTCVFRDSAFVDDVAKTNLAAILEQHGIATIRSL